MGAVFVREVKAYFSSILAWSLIAAYLLLVGFIVSFSFADYATSTMNAMQGGMKLSLMRDLVPPIVSTMGFLMLFFLPLLTMRLFSEEKRSGTLDLLLTYPLTEMQIIWGKFLATMYVVVIMLAFTVSGFIVMSRFTPIEWQVLASGYGALILLAAFFVAFGMWTSSLSSSQLVSASLTYGGLLLLWILSGIDRTGVLKEKFGELSALEHLNNMTKGVIDTQDVVYFVSLTLLFLFLNAMVLASRKWRG